MNITLEQFIYLAGAILLIYYFFETRIYLALWAAFLHFIIVIGKYFYFYKLIIVSYVVIVFVSYIYVLRNALEGKENLNDSKFNTIRKTLSENRNKKRRLEVAFLLFLAVAIIAILIF